MRKLAVVGVATLLTFCEPTTDPPIETSICSIVRNPARFDGRPVTVKAFLESNGRETSVLIDRACEGTTLLLVGVDGPVDRSVTRLSEDLVRGGRAGTTFDRDVSANFTGVFRMTGDGAKRRTFELTRVRDVKILARPNKHPGTR